jgi:membrane protein implicated in regulation of membrane protease activity
VDLGGLGAHWLWLLAAAILAILEIFVPGVFLVWIAAAAAITGVVMAVVPLALPFQLVLFGLLSAAAVYAGRRQYERNLVPSADPLLNDRVARLIGQTVTVETAIDGGAGRVRVGDGVWNARGPDAPAGARVRVTGGQGTCLTVEPVPTPPQIEQG